MAYNIQPQWYYRQQQRPAPRRAQNTGRAPATARREQTPNVSTARQSPKTVRGANPALPFSIGDPGDILLLTVLLFLYLESRDQDFLIILIVVGFSVLRNK